MKLNFVKALKSQMPSEDIAFEIVSLEKKRNDLEEVKNTAYEALKEVRGREMCGESISTQDDKETEENFNRAKLNLDIADDSVAKLEDKLRTTLLAECSAKEENARKAAKRLEREKQRLLREWTRAKGQLFAIGLAIWGHPEDVRHQLSDVRALLYENTDPLKKDFEQGIAQGEEVAGTPNYSTCYQKEVESPLHYVSWFDQEKEVRRLKRLAVEKLAKDKTL